jgi:glycosyltransferase involved in cell wall biosynthesis
MSLLRDDFHVRLICRNGAAPPTLRWPDGVRVDRVGPALSNEEKNAAPAAAKLREYLGFVAAVRRALLEERPRLVYAYEPHALVAVAGCRAPVVYHRHDIEDLGPVDRRSLQGWVMLAARRLGRSAALVVMPQEQRAIAYQRFVGDDRPALVLPNFPLRSTFPAPADWDAIFARRRERPELLFRGALGEDTGIQQAVAALPHLDAGVSLRVCGEGAPGFVRDLLAQAAALGVADRLRHDGWVPYPQLNAETLEAAVGLVLYRPAGLNWDMLGSATNKLYEYAACGVPAVVPDRASFRDFLGGEPWVRYADVADPAAVARQIQELLADRARYEALARAARRAFEERFNYEAVFAPLRARALALAGIRVRGA